MLLPSRLNCICGNSGTRCSFVRLDSMNLNQQLDTAVFQDLARPVVAHCILKHRIGMHIFIAGRPDQEDLNRG